MKLISVISPCYNEQDNVEPLYEAVRALFAGLPQYRYEHIFIDNASKDRTEIPAIVAQTDLSISAIADDAAGELYATDLSGGRLLEISASD